MCYARRARAMRSSEAGKALQGLAQLQAPRGWCRSAYSLRNTGPYSYAGILRFQRSIPASQREERRMRLFGKRSLRGPVPERSCSSAGTFTCRMCVHRPEHYWPHEEWRSVQEHEALMHGMSASRRTPVRQEAMRQYVHAGFERILLHQSVAQCGGRHRGGDCHCPCEETACQTFAVSGSG